MNIIKYILIFMFTSSVSYGKDNLQISLKSFIDNLRQELINMENSPERKKLPLLIENVKVELSVTSKVNAKGGIDFYVFSGDVSKENVSTQKISFNIVKEKTDTLLHLGNTPLINKTSPKKETVTGRFPAQVVNPDQKKIKVKEE